MTDEDNYMARRARAVRYVETFLDANYDQGHNCGDPDCPGNTYEADDIVSEVLRIVNGEDPHE